MGRVELIDSESGQDGGFEAPFAEQDSAQQLSAVNTEEHLPAAAESPASEIGALAGLGAEGPEGVEEAFFSSNTEGACLEVEGPIRPTAEDAQWTAKKALMRQAKLERRKKNKRLASESAVSQASPGTAGGAAGIARVQDTAFAESDEGELGQPREHPQISAAHAAETCGGGEAAERAVKQATVHVLKEHLVVFRAQEQAAMERATFRGLPTDRR